MNGNDNSRDAKLAEFIELYHTYEPLIKKIGDLFSAADSYGYRAMVCDLTTHLWMVMQRHPPGPDVRNQEAWVYNVLYHAALNIYRKERQVQSLLSFLPDLPDITEPAPDPLVSQLYHLISQLQPDEQVLITEYLDRKTYAQMAASRNLSIKQIEFRLKKIQKKLTLIEKRNQQP